MKKAIGDNMILPEWGFERGLELVKKAGFEPGHTPRRSAISAAWRLSRARRGRSSRGWMVYR